LAYAVYHLNVRSPYPGFVTLVPVAAAGVFILTTGASVNRHVLASRPLVFIGLISYPLYLWHFPLMAFARIMSETEPSRLSMAMIVIASVVLAWLTYRFIERPLRSSKKLPSKPGHMQIAGLLAAMVLVGALGWITVQRHGFPMRVPEEIRPFMLTGEETSINWRRGQCLLLPDQGASDFVDECSGNGKRPLLFVWGDSYAAALYAGLYVLSGRYEFGVAEYTASACPPLINYDHPERRFCKTINDFVLNKVAELRPEVVILHSTWSYSEEVLDTGLKDTVSRLKALGIKKIVLLGPVASWVGNGLAANVLDYYMHGAFTVIPARTKYRSNDVWTVALGKWLELRAVRLGIEYVSARDVMCNSEGCLARIGENGASLTAFDSGHLTLPGAEFVAGALLKNLLK
jgi:membrane protein implicated in regulation of membrane protease activity